MIKRFYLSVFCIIIVGAIFAQAPIIVSDTDGNISEINLPDNCNKRIIKNVGRSLSDITLHPNGKMYGVSFSREELYEIDTTNATSGTNSLTKIIDFPGIKMVGMTADVDGKIYITEGKQNNTNLAGRLFEVNVNNNSYVSKGVLAEGSAGDLTWYLGDLYNASANNKLVKVNIDNPESSVVIGTFTTTLSDIFSLVTNVYSCDSSITYGITEDKEYFRINMSNAVTTRLCFGSGARIFGSTSVDEFRASETCLIEVDLDENNSSGASGDDFNDDFNCETTSANIADVDVVVKADSPIDSVVVRLVDGVLDGANELLQLGSTPNISSNNNAQSISAVNGGSATVDNFETFLNTLKYVNTAAVPSLGDRKIEVIAYSIDGSSSVAVATISIASTINAGNDNSVTFCSSDNPLNLVNSLGGNPDAGGSWTPVLASGNNQFNPSIDTAGDYTYSVSDGCFTVSAVVSVSIDSAVNAGTNGALIVCETDSAVNLFTLLGDNPDSGGSWSPALTSGTGIFDPSEDAANTYTYTVIGCNTATATVSVSINNIPSAGDDGTLNLCENSDPTDLIDGLEGSPDAGGSWSPNLTSGTGVFDPTVDLAGIYTYTIIGCDTSTAEVTVIVDSTVDAGTDGTLTICTTGDPVNLFNSLNGSPEEGGTWSPALSNSDPNIFDPSVETSGVYTYTVTGPGNCADAQAEVVVTVSMCAVTLDLDTDNSSGITGSDYATSFDCTETSANIADIDVDIVTDANIDSLIIELTSGMLDGANEFLVTNQDANFQSNDSTQRLVIIIDAFTNTIEDIEAFINGVQYVNILDPFTEGDRVITVTIYNQDGSATALSTISLINTKANAGIDNTVQVSDLDPAFNLFESLGGSPDEGGSWSPALSSDANLFDPSVEESGTYTYIVSNDCDTDSATVTVEVEVTNDCDLASLFVPNAFSPNGGGDIRNEQVFVNLLGSHDRLDFRIYNRWGEMVFQTTDITIGWDGVYNGKSQSTDVFGYYIEVECNGEIVQQKGNITLIR